MIDGVSATLLGSLTGFGASILTPVVSYFQTRQEHKFTLAKMDKEMEMAKAGAAHEKKMYAIKADDEEHARLLEHSKAMVSGSLRSMVRPVYAFTFLGMFMAVMVATIIIGVAQGLDAVTIIEAVWSPSTRAIFAGICSFYFGSRSMEKFMSRGGK